MDSIRKNAIYITNMDTWFTEKIRGIHCIVGFNMMFHYLVIESVCDCLCIGNVLNYYVNVSVPGVYDCGSVWTAVHSQI